MGGSVTALGAALALWVSGAIGAVGAAEEAGDSCPSGPRALTVAAAPELATVLAAATSTSSGNLLGRSGACIDVQVRAADPADVASTARGVAADGPHVWLSDSSLWFEALPKDALGRRVSTAQSPVVFALSDAVASTLGWPAAAPDAVEGMTSGRETRLALPDTDRSAAARAGLLALNELVPPQPDGRQRLATVFRAAERSAPDGADSLLEAVKGPGSFAVPTTEQVVWAHGARTGEPSVVASYPDGGSVLDYPLVVLTDDEVAKANAELLLQAVSSPAWAKLVQAAGFRAADGSAGPELATQAGVEPSAGRTALPADPRAVQEAVRVFDAITAGSRLLAVVDVSGSMGTRVPEVPGRTLMDLAVGAAGNGLGLYPDDASVGLWAFSTNMTKTSDHVELMPIGTLGLQPDGSRGRERLARALSGVTVVPHGDTALYDTALDAVRAVREDWDPKSVNSVVLLTDGRNDDDNGLSLEQLLSELSKEPAAKPVPVIGIAFGPDADVEALREISRVTGGTTYEVQDVRRIHEVLADALSQRPCRPNC